MFGLLVWDKGRILDLVFSSPIFLFAFLPIVFLLYRVVPGLRVKNLLLAVASLIFYAFGQIGYMPLFLGSIVLNYVMGLLLQKESITARKAVVMLAVVINLAVLGVYKYTDFILGILNSLLGLRIPLPAIELPIGISFFTFQGLSYVIDVYRDRDSGTRSFLTVLLYISFFPQLIAGPIVKYHDIAEQIDNRTCSAENTAAGIQRFIAGLGKKVLISNTVGLVADTVFNEYLTAGMDFRLAWLGGICYALQIYFDFGGYSDMAIGMGKLFGFTFKENFNYPYGAKSIKEFWRKWHISLSTWFREYLYIPLGGNRLGKKRAALNRMIVFLCTGIWHGANWTFILWGVFHGVLSALEDWNVIPVQRLEKSRLGRGISRVYTLLSVMLLFVLFRADTVQDAWVMISSMFRFRTSAYGAYLVRSLLSGAVLVTLLLSAVLSVGAARKLSNWMLRTPVWVQDTYMICKRLGSLLVLALSVLSLAQGGFNPFIYFQF